VKNQELSVPQSKLRNYEDDANLLVSEGVLVFDNQRYAFFHEGFFDYCFANWFLAQIKISLAFCVKANSIFFVAHSYGKY